MMKKTIVISLLCLLSASVPALDFFGIEYTGNTADNILNLIAGVAEGRQEVIEEYLSRLKETDSSLAKKIKIEELKIPCTICCGKDSESCLVCAGTGTVADSQALGYLQYKFSTALEEGKTERVAWREAKAAFDEKKAKILDAETLFGTVIRNEDRGLLLSRQDSEETVYLEGIDPSFSAGASINGQVWTNGTHVYEAEDGSSVEVPSYTATLWMD